MTAPHLPGTSLPDYCILLYSTPRTCRHVYYRSTGPHATVTPQRSRGERGRREHHENGQP